MSRRDNRFVVYLYSRKNVAGSLLALGGLVLFFTGLVGWLWPFIVVGLYLIGALAMPGERSLDLAAGGDAADVRGLLAHQVSAVKGKVPDDVYGKVVSIQQTILGILPRLRQQGPASQDAFVVRRTATDYLPRTLEAYLNLPRAYAVLHRLPDGRTPAGVLSDQLSLLDMKLQEVAEAVNKQDTDQLLANGRFLEDRFGSAALSLPGEGKDRPAAR
jgi:hypothetical protein